MRKVAFYTFLLSFVSSVYSSIFNWKDAFSYPKFSFEWSPDVITISKMDELKSQLSNEKLWTRLRSGNEEYFCIYPNMTAIEQKSPLEQPAHDIDELRKQGLSALQTLNELVVVGNRGYWTYDYVHNQFARQYHLEPSPESIIPIIEPLYFLGKASSQNESQQLSEEQLMVKYDEGKAYLQTTYYNGTNCDVTNKPRTVVLNYECEDDDSTPRVSQYQEVSSCFYSMKIHVPALCKHKAFQPVDDSPSENIVCYRIYTGSDNYVHAASIKSQASAETSARSPTKTNTDAEVYVGRSVQPTSNPSDAQEEL
ncbi:sensor for misfolded ER glycoproteins Yos9 [Schizosaccharomyces cryophilus OY26]|uniref:Endoplasmic reticulum lectin n=1 Tax=Schizosaccharomyces cryophilus (strain OY26 / ATCC MYA-4695 / CBS 11777 / NBRC 106824 / NRRL Y48691) TaxID=653667 RepID=S9X797_SCHCR|nr:sensor for misfolded ER glycoproteins Yos9 [Schizosaccharomyces cryophilus OY26]EPY49646.1 sensor for misfolded ER glycoproteins Yos9 [Schizosaccharomyces cryophilus OY26]